MLVLIDVYYPNGPVCFGRVDYFAIRKLPSLLVREDNTYFMCYCSFHCENCCVAKFTCKIAHK